jgi:hypothetical protein
VAATFGPFVVFRQHGANQTGDGVAVGEDGARLGRPGGASANR